MGSQSVHIDDLVLAEIVRRLAEAFHPEQIYLFGSQARADAGPDSDYDLMVIVPDSAPPERRDSRHAHEVLWGLWTAVDVLVWTKNAFESCLHLKASLPSIILDEGRLVYAA